MGNRPGFKSWPYHFLLDFGGFSKLLNCLNSSVLFGKVRLTSLVSLFTGLTLICVEDGA